MLCRLLHHVSVSFQAFPNIAGFRTVYHLDEKKAQQHLVKFKDYLKEELPKKMWKDLQPDLGIFADEQKVAMKAKIVDMVRNCTDNFFEMCQRSFLSPPSSPGPSEKSNKEGLQTTLGPAYEAVLGSATSDSQTYGPLCFVASWELEASTSTSEDEALGGDFSIKSHVGTNLKLTASQDTMHYEYGMTNPPSAADYQSHLPQHVDPKQWLSSPAQFQPFMLEHDLAGMDYSTNCDSSDIISSLGTMNPSIFINDDNHALG